VLIQDSPLGYANDQAPLELLIMIDLPIDDVKIFLLPRKVSSPQLFKLTRDTSSVGLNQEHPPK